MLSLADMQAVLPNFDFVIEQSGDIKSYVYMGDGKCIVKLKTKFTDNINELIDNYHIINKPYPLVCEPFYKKITTVYRFGDRSQIYAGGSGGFMSRALEIYGGDAEGLIGSISFAAVFVIEDNLYVVTLILDSKGKTEGAVLKYLSKICYALCDKYYANYALEQTTGSIAADLTEYITAELQRIHGMVAPNTSAHTPVS